MLIGLHEATQKGRSLRQKAGPASWHKPLGKDHVLVIGQNEESPRFIKPVPAVVLEIRGGVAAGRAPKRVQKFGKRGSITFGTRASAQRL